MQSFQCACDVPGVGWQVIVVQFVVFCSNAADSFDGYC